MLHYRNRHVSRWIVAFAEALLHDRPVTLIASRVTLPLVTPVQGELF